LVLVLGIGVEDDNDEESGYCAFHETKIVEMKLIWYHV